MYLKKLYCDDKRFKNIKFNENGFSIILGKKTSSSSKQTTNGVGKTLTIGLIDFCLGAKLKKELTKLDPCNIYLDCVIDDKNYTISRNTEFQSNITLNEKGYSLNELKYFLETNLFYFGKELESLSLRSLISKFIRIPPEGYVNWNQCKKSQGDDINLLVFCYLLDIDTEFVSNKINITKTIKNLKDSKKTIEKEEIVKEIIANGVDIDVSISALTKDISDLNKKIEEFKISEAYNELIEEAELLKHKKNDINNDIFAYQKRIEYIESSLKVEPDIAADKVVDFYKNANVEVPDMIVKELNQVYDFHERLLTSRKVRLRKDKEDFLKKLSKDENELKKINCRINELNKILADEGSKYEYEVLQNELYEKKLKLQKAEEYKRILKEIEEKLMQLDIDLATETKRTQEYLDKIKDYTEHLSTIFKTYVDEIYELKKEAGIKFANNTGKGKLRFDIEPMISGEASEGINRVKMFCMDLLILTQSKNNNVEFIYHDSSIFNGVDPRQIYKMLKLAKNICQDKYQYIFNINTDTIENIIDVAQSYNDTEFVRYLKNRVVVELLDDKDEDKLLGYYVDLKK